MSKRRPLPEIPMRGDSRAGYIPNWSNTDGDTELWTVWMRRADVDDRVERRATEADLKAIKRQRKALKGSKR